jgi:DNA ligase (NAD+)
VRLPQDIFKLNYDKIASLDGWGKLSVANLRYSINEKKIISLEKFIYSLGIRHIGLENAKLISKHLKKLSSLIDLSKKNNFRELLNVDGIGETQINSIKNFFSNNINLKMIQELSELVDVKDAVLAKSNGLLNNKTFMITGKLEGISRAEAKSLIEENSGSIISNVSKKLDYLIIGEKPTKRKIDLAKDFKVKILSQDEWLNMLNKTS